MTTGTMCEWCGHDHAVTALCTQRPTWGRRGFLALMGAAAVGAMLPAPEPTKFLSNLGGTGKWVWLQTDKPVMAVSFDVGPMLAQLGFSKEQIARLGRDLYRVRATHPAGGEMLVTAK